MPKSSRGSLHAKVIWISLENEKIVAGYRGSWKEVRTCNASRCGSFNRYRTTRPAWAGRVSRRLWDRPHHRGGRARTSPTACPYVYRARREAPADGQPATRIRNSHNRGEGIRQRLDPHDVERLWRENGVWYDTRAMTIVRMPLAGYCDPGPISAPSPASDQGIPERHGPGLRGLLPRRSCQRCGMTPGVCRSPSSPPEIPVR